MSAKVEAKGDKGDDEPAVDVKKEDVLCGYGRECFEHEGNKRLRGLIAAQVLRYQFATRSEKSIIIRCIMEDFSANGGRFLKRHSKKKYWYDGGRHVGYEKVAHALRDAMANKAKWANPIMAQNFLLDMNQSNMKSNKPAITKKGLPPAEEISPYSARSVKLPRGATAERAGGASKPPPAPTNEQPASQHVRLQQSLQNLHHQLRVLPSMIVPPMRSDTLMQNAVLGHGLEDILRVPPKSSGKQGNANRRYEPVAIIPALVCVPLSSLPASSLGEIEALKTLNAEGLESLRAGLDPHQV